VLFGTSSRLVHSPSRCRRNGWSRFASTAPGAPLTRRSRPMVLGLVLIAILMIATATTQLRGVGI
jgi:hypothetical protein